MAQCGECKHDQWGGYLTVLVVNRAIISSICILTVVFRLMIKLHVDTLCDCFLQEVKWMLAIHYLSSTVSELDLDLVHHLPQALLLENDTHCRPQGNQ